MPNYRKIVRDKVKAALSHATTGFNAQFSAIRSTYGVDPISIDFNPGSTSFVQMHLAPEDVASSQLIAEDRNCAMLVYTSAAQNANLAKSHAFSGSVQAHIDIHVRYEEGCKDDDTESTCDCVEDAVITSLNAYSWGSGVLWNRLYSCERVPMRYLGDGWQMTIPIVLMFDVYVQ